MDSFTDAYTKTREVVANQQYEDSWQTFLTTQCHVGTLLGADGLEQTASGAPDQIRTHLADLVQAGKTAGDVIYAAAKSGTPDQAENVLERAGALKLMRHIYLAAQAGAQGVWVYDPPKDYEEWIYDALAAAGNEAEVKRLLTTDAEIYSATERGYMSAAVGVARKCCGDAQTKLAALKTYLENAGDDYSDMTAANQATLDVVYRWFMDEDCRDAEIIEATTKLASGFQDIAVACNAKTLVFADDPSHAERQEFPSIYGSAAGGGEGGAFPVVYLGQLFLDSGSTGTTWLCAETIIHELSHFVLDTDDIRYDTRGLKPRAQEDDETNNFKYADAIKNADSWGYFAIDLEGLLSDGDRNTTWQ